MLHTLPDDGRSISPNVAEKYYDSRHDKLIRILSGPGVLPRIKLNYLVFDPWPLSKMVFHLRTTVPFVTAHLEIFHCKHHQVIPKSDLYFTFCSTLNALSKRTSK